MKERVEKIIEVCLEFDKSINPMEIFVHIASQDFVRIHGPEHHILDGACILTAFYNAGGEINLEEALVRLGEEGQKMP